MNKTLWIVNNENNNYHIYTEKFLVRLITSTILWKDKGYECHLKCDMDSKRIIEKTGMLHLWKLIDDEDTSDYIIVPVSHLAFNMIDDEGRDRAYSTIEPALGNKSIELFKGLIQEAVEYAEQLSSVKQDFVDIDNSDVLLFRKFIPEDLMNVMNKRIDDRYDEIMAREIRFAEFPFEGLRGRIEIYKDEELLNLFNDFWYTMVEDQFQMHYLKYVPKHTVQAVKDYHKTDWKDLFLQVYNADKFEQSKNDAHIDHSGITIIGCIADEYEGGELYFPKQKVQVKLKKGDLVVFNGSFTHPHGLSPLSEGERRVFVGQSLGPLQYHKFGKKIIDNV